MLRRIVKTGMLIGTGIAALLSGCSGNSEPGDDVLTISFKNGRTGEVTVKKYFDIDRDGNIELYGEGPVLRLDGKVYPAGIQNQSPETSFWIASEQYNKEKDNIGYSPQPGVFVMSQKIDGPMTPEMQQRINEEYAAMKPKQLCE